MRKRKMKGGGNACFKWTNLLITLMCEIIVLFVIGTMASWMIVNGWIERDATVKCGCAALLISGIAGGLVICRRRKTAPLLKGMAAGGMLTIVCVVCGILVCDASEVMGLRLLLPIAGGSVSGIITALRK